MNINDTSAIRECTSCQMCGAVCPTLAISIQLNSDGFYRPVIDVKKCIDCSLCVKSCYKFDKDVHLTDNLDDRKLYAAWAKDPKVLDATTSGGIADILAKKLARDGYKCIGVTYDPCENRAIGVVATSEEDTQAFRGSKYIQSYSVDAFKALVKDCKKERFAVFGLPCQIYAIDRFLRMKGERKRHILIDLYCHGCPSLNLWTKYICELKNKVNGKRIISANFRSKLRGWGNFYVVVVVVVVEGVRYPIKVVSPRINDPFYTMFFSDLVLNDSCYDCSLRSTLEYTDIRLGDFWGHSYIKNHKGISGVTLCTPVAETCFRDIEHEVTFAAQDFGNFLPYQSYGKRYSMPDKIRHTLFAQLSSPETSLKTVLKTYKASLSLKQKIAFYCKNFMKLMPNSIISYAKGIAYTLKQ